MYSENQGGETMQRYFVSKEQMSHSSVTITGDDVKHIAKVMRMQVGDRIICCNNEGETAICEIREITQSSVRAVIVEQIQEKRELPIKIIIAQALPKGDKLEYVIQKGTELGATQFLLFQGDRSVVKWDGKKGDKKLERYCKIAKEAAEQSHRNIIPQVNFIQSLKEIILRASFYTKKIFAYEEMGKRLEHWGLKESFQQLKAGDSLLIVIGPEGGLSEKEVEFLLANDFLACSLGPRILRTETAALYVLAAASYHFEL